MLQKLIQNNHHDYKNMYDKYTKLTLLSLIDLWFRPSKRKRVQMKIRRIPEKFLNVFDQKSYLDVNEDVQEGIKAGQFDNALEHFIFYGYDEAREGRRRMGNAFTFMSEEEYVEVNPDVKSAVEAKSFSCGFEHFLLFGYEEFLSGTRKIAGVYPFSFSEDLARQVQKSFDETRYLEANPTVTALIEEQKVKSAWAHFVDYGHQAIRVGEQPLYAQIPPLSEVEYVMNNQDIFDALKAEKLTSPYTHFLLYGANELLLGTRKMKGMNMYHYLAPTLTDEIKEEIEIFKEKPLMSVIMPVYNVDVKWLELAIASLKAQWYPHWEICIADDKSTKEETVEYLKSIDDTQIKIVFLEENLNISGASNEALRLAKGKYVVLMDNDDELTPDALYETVKVINQSAAEFIYSDEDKLELDGRFSDPHFKADYAPDMFLSQNYISHLGMIKTSLVEDVGGWRVGFEGSQDYDLYLRVLEQTDKIVHIPKVLYHWRKVVGSTAAVFSDKSYAQKAGAEALKDAMSRRGIKAKVENGKYPGTYRVQYALQSTPLVSIIIPFKDKPELLDMCLNSILDKSTYQNYEIIGMSNNSIEEATFEKMKTFEAKESRVKFYEYNHPFNYSQINNYAVKHYAKGEHILLLNNDIEIISPSWIEEMLEFSQREDVGAVGAKLYYPDDTIQHAGVSIGVLTLAGHNFRHLGRNVPGYMGRESVIQNVSAVTAACLMIKKKIYTEVSGLNETNLKIAFNDIDFCLRLGELGYKNIYTPYCEAYHHESISRGSEDSPEKVARFNSEVEYMLQRHKEILKNGDPYYNVNLTLEHENFEIR